jgi:signal transduction histidine kinase
MKLTPHRLALVNSLAIFGAVALFALVFVPVRNAVTLHVIDSELAAMGESAAQSPAASPQVTDVFAPRPVFIQSVRLSDGTIQTRSANIGNAQLPVDQASLARARSGDGQPWFESIAVDGHQLRTYERPMRLNAADPQATVDGILEVASPLDDTLPRGPILVSLIVGIVIGAIGLLALGWLLARVALAPVEQLAATVDSIGSTHDLHRRLPEDRFGAVRLDPVVRLTYAFNAMLDRLESSTEQLEASLQLQRQFVGDASHQLRTPLTSLRGNVELLSRMCAEDCPVAALDEHQAVLGDLDAETQRMSRLVTGLLSLARADAQQHLTLVALELEPIIEDAWRSARSLSDSVVVELGEVPSGVRVRGDADRLLQLVVVLLENAVQYSPPGGRVQLRCVLEERHARAGVAVEVADAGPGIPTEERGRIFERFYRGRSTATMAEGVGLGLSVARWIAIEHEGEISVRDNVRCGSVFEVWLPTMPSVAQ